jgi:Lrp/AsnC family transcriptional regulator
MNDTTPRSTPRRSKGSTMDVGIDKIDCQILTVLQDDASQSATEIAKIVGLSAPQCWKRIRRLKKTGYIAKIVALLDRERFCLASQFFVQIKVVRNDQASLAEFSQAIRELPEVLECHVILGTYDFLLPDVDAYRRFYFGKLIGMPQIREMNYFMSISQAKYTTALSFEC